MIAILARWFTTVFGTRISEHRSVGKNRVRAMATPPPVSERPTVEGVLPKAFGPVVTRFKCSILGRRPLRDLGGEHIVRSQPPGKWNGIKLFEIVF